MSISILGMRIVTQDAWGNGDRLVAKFDCILGFVKLDGCLLILTRKGRLLAQMPRLGRDRREGKPISIIDADVRLSLNIMASASFYAMGNVLPDICAEEVEAVVPSIVFL